MQLGSSSSTNEPRRWRRRTVGVGVLSLCWGKEAWSMERVQIRVSDETGAEGRVVVFPLRAISLPSGRFVFCKVNWIGHFCSTVPKPVECFRRSANHTSTPVASESMESFDSPGDEANGNRRPTSILLDREAHATGYCIDQPPDIADNSNETTATAKSKGGHTMAVTFWAADPPDLSFFSVVCTIPPDAVSKTADFKGLSYVVGAEGRFVLLRAHFVSRFGRKELFMYTAAGDTESPSLERIPLPDDDSGLLTAGVDRRIHGVEEFGIIPRGLHYLVVALCDDADKGSLDYCLRIYSSESKTWSSKTLQKYYAQEDQTREGASPRLFRDLACVDGKLKFIETEYLEPPSDPRDYDVLYDLDLIRLLENVDKPKPRHGWRAVTWSRTLSSNCWCKEHDVDVADILDDESAADSSLLSGLRGEGETVGKLKFRDLYSVFPTLSIDNGDIVYLICAAEPSDQNGWVVTVDLGNKTVKALGAYPFKKYDLTKQAFRTSTLSLLPLF
ncbi:hypothetical protein HU200_025704 [Digitaria exilis]|uniref:DUF1618 domain-containing protein n=1 Tax=Digitaria exilis TaxID=1010633 RepID=A0A835C519_9POAL|nr:hypothetical protein HU200_025704 [Digitaria exilis]